MPSFFDLKNGEFQLSKIHIKEFYFQKSRLKCNFVVESFLYIIKKIVGENFQMTFSSMLRWQPNTVHFEIFTTLH